MKVMSGQDLIDCLVDFGILNSLSVWLVDMHGLSYHS